MPPEVGAHAADFRAAASQFATGITVVTTVLHGVDHAMTVNSFTAVSLDPLLVLVCAERSTRFHDAVLGSRLWAVSVLPETGQAHAAWLATKGRPLEGQLDRVPHVRGPLTGAALLVGSLSVFECETYAEHDGGDHTIVVGRVWAPASTTGRPAPLVYHRGAYRTVAPSTDLPSSKLAGADGGRIFRAYRPVGCGYGGRRRAAGRRGAARAGRLGVRRAGGGGDIRGGRGLRRAGPAGGQPVGRAPRRTRSTRAR